MLNEAEIRRKLREDPGWEPDESASDDEWELFEEVREDLSEKGKSSDEDEEDEDEKEDDDSDWSYDDDDY